ncbi:potassium channel subfamily K member 5a [Callorhinchus milii]|uniref:Potassium channel, subfamily K, member 5b n=1 Tax=Callorhinchus milii TaxID=7868 RepID=A0A4W3I111_CALMI|nr:potassium channel subfamily K member 5a [Callorhinchus milii]
MVDRGPLLTSAIIFYLAIGAAIFHVLEEPNWTEAVEQYKITKLAILKAHPCLTQAALEKILEDVEKAAGQGVTITGNKTFNNWNWPNAVIFAATVITTIGYGNIAPKTSPGRLFCIFYGLFGVPLCLSWITALGKFFGGRAKKLGKALTRKGVSPRKAQITCTAIFILWGVLLHLLMPPLVFMVTEGWSYIEGLYFSFITISTIGFGDFVAGIDPNANYHVLYRYFVELWIYLGLAWLSLFINWKVSMFVQVHKAIKKRRKRRRGSFELEPNQEKPLGSKMPRDSKEVNIFQFLTKKQEGYNDLIQQIGSQALKAHGSKTLGVDALAEQMVREETPVPNECRKIGLKRFCYETTNLSAVHDHDTRMPLNSKKDLGNLADGAVRENQLDRAGGEDNSIWEGHRHPLLFFENINITFTDELNLSDKEKVELSRDENVTDDGDSDILPPTPNSNDSDYNIRRFSRSSLEYEQLMNRYNKVHNTEAVT